MLRQLLRGLRDAAPASAPVDRELATAVLLVEVARADYEDHPGELEAVRQALVQEFGMDAARVDALVGDAQRESKAAVSLHDYLSVLNAQLMPGDKRELLRRLWQVAWADGQISPLEEHALRKLADLLHVPHHEFIQGKLATAPGA